MLRFRIVSPGTGTDIFQSRSSKSISKIHHINLSNFYLVHAHALQVAEDGEVEVQGDRRAEEATQVQKRDLRTVDVIFRADS